VRRFIAAFSAKALAFANPANSDWLRAAYKITAKAPLTIGARDNSQVGAIHELPRPLDRNSH